MHHAIPGTALAYLLDLKQDVKSHDSGIDPEGRLQAGCQLPALICCMETRSHSKMSQWFNLIQCSVYTIGYLMVIITLDSFCYVYVNDWESTLFYLTSLIS